LNLRNIILPPFRLLRHTIWNKHLINLSFDNAGDTLKKIKSEQYSLILSDEKMPGMRGIELYEYIEEMDLSSLGRIVFITGVVVGVDTDELLYSSGACYFLNPLDIDELTAEVRSIVADST